MGQRVGQGWTAKVQLRRERGLRTGTLDTPSPTCRVARGSAQSGQSGAMGRAGGWVLSIPRPLATPEARQRGWRAGGALTGSRVNLRLGRQASGPPEPVWGFWKLQFTSSHPANQALSTGKSWEPPPPLAGVGQSSPVLVTRSRKFYRKQHKELGGKGWRALLCPLLLCPFLLLGRGLPPLPSLQRHSTLCISVE